MKMIGDILVSTVVALSVIMMEKLVEHCYRKKVDYYSLTSEVLSSVKFYNNLMRSTMPMSEASLTRENEKSSEAQRVFRELATRTFAFNNTLKFQKLWQVIGIPSHEDLSELERCLLFLSNSTGCYSDNNENNICDRRAFKRKKHQILEILKIRNES